MKSPPTKDVKVVLRFASQTFSARIYPTAIGHAFLENLPYETTITKWGRELYGPIEHDFGEESPIPVIPEGGIAYTNRGNYVCVFFGQAPAWAVDHIGEITSPLSPLNDIRDGERLRIEKEANG